MGRFGHVCPISVTGWAMRYQEKRDERVVFLGFEPSQMASPVTLLAIVYPFISLVAYEEAYTNIVYPPKPSLREASVAYTHIVYPIKGLATSDTIHTLSGDVRKLWNGPL